MYTRVREESKRRPQEAGRDISGIQGSAGPVIMASRYYTHRVQRLGQHYVNERKRERAKGEGGPAEASRLLSDVLIVGQHPPIRAHVAP